MGDLSNVYKYLKGGCKEDRTRLILAVPSTRTRGNVHKLKHKRFCLTICKAVFSVQVSEHRLPKEVGESLDEKIFRLNISAFIAALLS